MHTQIYENIEVGFLELGMVAHSCNPSTWEVKEGGLLVQCQQGYKVRRSLKDVVNQNNS